MIKFLKVTLAIPFLISLNINAQNYQRIINWDYQQNWGKVQFSQTSEYLFFPKAVYDDHETMIPSYFELFPIASTLIALSIGIVTYRYNKGGIYIAMFSTIAIYLTLTTLVSTWNPQSAPIIVFIATFLIAYQIYQKRIRAMF